MKLIINIPDWVYNAFKNNSSNCINIANIIANGTPLDEYETIFAEGLLDGLKVSVKAEIEDYFSWGDISSTDQKAILNIIDKHMERSKDAKDSN